MGLKKLKWGCNKYYLCLFLKGDYEPNFLADLMKIVAYIISIFIILSFASCEKDKISFDSSLKLSFSADTVLFDTVFTTIGSATRSFRVYNRNSWDIQISSVRLAGGSSSHYRMNVDGEPTSFAKNILLRSNDSLYVFVEVTVDPTQQNAPLFIPDSIVFETNGNIQDVKLFAWGQDVNLLSSHSVSGLTTFTSDKPYLIYNYLYVPPTAELVIQPGAKLHFHNRSYLIVDGTLKVNGDPIDPVILQGDRLEEFYRDKAGQWGGIFFRPGSKSNQINWAEIKNAIIGVRIDTFATPDIPALILNSTKIENMSAAALLAQGSIVDAGNCLFANAGQIAVMLRYGGKYRFYHCTIANYWGQYIHRKGPALLINNYYTYRLVENGPIFLETRDIEEAYFVNCIIYGSRSNELEIDNIYKGQVVNAQMNHFFENTLLRVETGIDVSDQNHFKNILLENPKFMDPFKYNYELDTLSPAKDFGLQQIAIQFPFDLKGNSRLLDSAPDLGAFERVE